MFKFVTSDASNPNGKRKQTSRACESCRKRKKRCLHDIDSEELVQESVNGAPIQDPPSTATGELRGIQNSPNSTMEISDIHQRNSPIVQLQTPPRRSRNEESCHNTASPSFNSRFIGDLNPETVFLTASTPDATRDASTIEGVGIWLAKALSGKHLQPDAELPGLFNGSNSILPKILMPALQEEALSTLPPQPHLTALSTVYLEKMHPILPIIDQSLIQTLPSTDARWILLMQGMCLAASNAFGSSPHLALSGSSTTLERRDFRNKVSAAMKMIIEMNLVTDKMVLIQALAIMSHFTDSPEIASQEMSRAIQLTFSLGLQIHGHHQRDGHPNSITLFCCVWALDRMNAAFHGRPVNIHNRDIGRNLGQIFMSQKPVFRLLLEVTLLLDQIIGLYRPSYDLERSTHESEFPSFEELVSRSTSSTLATSALATIEMFYHAVAMLSYRSKAWDTSQRSSSSFLRQSLASSHVSFTTSREVHDHIVLFQFVPYTFSMSLSVAYREMRYNRMPTSRSRARAQFANNCEILSELGTIFGSAGMMAEMGKSTLKEMDRVYSLVAVSEQQKIQPEACSSVIDSTGIVNQPNGDESKLFPRAETLANANVKEVLGRCSSDSYNTRQDVPPQGPDFEPSLPVPASEVDLFSLFDPGFGIDTIDAQFWENLDPSFPSQFDEAG